MKRVLAIAMVLLAGCGQSVPNAGQGTAAASPSAAPSGAATVLVAVSEGSDQGCASGCKGRLAIVGVDGQVRARTAFNPPRAAVVGCEGSYITNPVQVAAGAVYYMDDTGLVRRLSATGAIREVAHFPIRTSQQLMWLAVSPDGKRLMAAIMVYPPLSPTWDPSKGCPIHEQGRIHEELDGATAGGSTTVLSDQDVPQQVMSLGGWDSTGAVAIPQTQIAYIGYIQGTTWGGSAVHLDPQGKASGSPIGGADCQPLFGETAGGRLICYTPKQPTVRDSAGQVLWTLKSLDPKDEFSYGAVALSPDASRVAFRLNSHCCFTFDSSVIRSRDGVRIGLGSNFDPQGWVDNQTVIGAQGSVQPTCSGCPPDFAPTTLGLISVSAPTQVKDLGISGRFLGVLSS